VINELPPFEGSPKRRAPDMQKTKDLLEFESQISLPEGIEKTWAWYRENIFGSADRSAI
jgi:nucleoside-diphosphate-sugar epimerase